MSKGQFADGYSGYRTHVQTLQQEVRQQTNLLHELLSRFKGSQKDQLEQRVANSIANERYELQRAQEATNEAKAAYQAMLLAPSKNLPQQLGTLQQMQAQVLGMGVSQMTQDQRRSPSNLVTPGSPQSLSVLPRQDSSAAKAGQTPSKYGGTLQQGSRGSLLKVPTPGGDRFSKRDSITSPLLGEPSSATLKPRVSIMLPQGGLESPQRQNTAASGRDTGEHKKLAASKLALPMSLLSIQEGNEKSSRTQGGSRIEKGQMATNRSRITGLHISNFEENATNAASQKKAVEASTSDAVYRQELETTTRKLSPPMETQLQRGKVPWVAAEDIPVVGVMQAHNLPDCATFTKVYLIACPLEGDIDFEKDIQHQKMCSVSCTQLDPEYDLAAPLNLDELPSQMLAILVQVDEAFQYGGKILAFATIPITIEEPDVASD